jgi:tetrahydromethanopterin S-methyltransferase subunit D
VQVLVALLGASAGLLALAWMAYAWARGDQPHYWLLTGLESCIVLGGVFGVLFGLGKFQEGPGMAIACVAGTVFAGAVLSWVSVKSGLTLHGGGAASPKPMLFARLAISGALGALAAFEVLKRSRQSVHYILRALATGVPLLAIALAGWRFGGSIAGAAAPAWIVWTVVVVVATLACVLFCACAHCVIRAFEVGRLDAPPAPGARAKA